MLGRHHAFIQATPMRHDETQRSPLQALETSLREPAGLICAALVLALIAVIVQIAAVW